MPDAGISTGFEFDSQRNFPYIDPHTRSYKGEEKGSKNDPIRIPEAFPIKSNHDYKRLGEMISLAPLTIKKIYERKVFPKDETIRKLAIVGNNTFRNIYESLLDHFKDSGNLADCVSCGDLYYRKRENQSACGKGLCRSYSSKRWYKQKKKLNEKFKSHFSF